MTSVPDVELRHVTKAFGGVVAVDDVSLAVAQGELLSLLGPSGCGKTTTLRLIAGFERPTRGDVYIRNVLVNDVPAYRRHVGVVFQNYAIFPHMTVFDNVAFGLRMKGWPPDRVAQEVREALSLVQLTGLEGRYRSQLSGGQQQRVALARAIVTRPAVLLLDEPLAALDRKLRDQVRIEIRELQRRLRITTIYVTHDQDEALVLSDRIAVMEQGRIVQVGTPAEIYGQPRSHFVADFIGASNFLGGEVAGADGGWFRVRVGDGRLFRVLAGVPVTPGERVDIAVRPEKITMDPERPRHDNWVEGTIERVVFQGMFTEYHVRLRNGEIFRVTQQNREPDGQGAGWTVGVRVYLSWPVECSVLLRSRAREARA
jgi:spermidine/putrescine ABC transporter ATP-binding subunit